MSTSPSRRFFCYLFSLVLNNLVIGLVIAQPLYTAESAALVDQLHDQPDSDQIVARISIKEAAIASVAQARVEIALHKARRKAEHLSCTGRWTPTGPISMQQSGTGKVAARLVSQDSDYWYYRVARKPQPLTCENASRADYFLEMSRHLPEWVVIRLAGQQFAFQKGRTVLPQTTVLALAQ